ncbi:hypothetical protein OO013_05290 [Mangrovivirga sp. M17]|uniref:Lipoprotein n=1 Tax=Mangrovivirga halotolerans TaxID=2993936 RepID=A0ABT3RN81_9BACT|nr:hypothetical protein [Mangrovivirga halotolerans]MCX2743267.1 hypothetical protein [Mangrovivirga halotolerans]
MIKRLCFIFLIALFFGCSNNDPVGQWEIHTIYDHKGLNEYVDNMSREEKLAKIKTAPKDSSVLRIVFYDKESLDDETLDNIMKEAHFEMFSSKVSNSFIALYEDKSFSYYIEPYYFEGSWRKKGESVVQLNIENNKFYSSSIDLKLHENNGNYSFQNLTHDETTLWVYDRVNVSRSNEEPKYRLPENNLWRKKDLEARKKVKNLLKFWTYVFDDAIINKKTINKSSKYYQCPFRFYSIGLTVYSIDNQKINQWKATFKNQEEFEKGHQILIQALKDAKFPTEKNLSKYERNLKFFQDAYKKI